MLAVEKLVHSKLLVPGSNRRIGSLDGHVGCATAGLLADGKAFMGRGRDEAQNYRDTYRESAPLKVSTNQPRSSTSQANHLVVSICRDLQTVLDSLYRPLRCTRLCVPLESVRFWERSMMPMHRVMAVPPSSTALSHLEFTGYVVIVYSM